MIKEFRKEKKMIPTNINIIIEKQNYKYKEKMKELFHINTFSNYKNKIDISFLSNLNNFLFCFEQLFSDISLGKKNILETILKSENTMNFFLNNHISKQKALSLDIEKVIINNFSVNLKMLEKNFMYYIKKYQITKKDYSLSSKQSIQKVYLLLSDLIKANPNDLCIFYLFRSIKDSEESLKKTYNKTDYKRLNKKYYVMQWQKMFENLKEKNR